MGFLIVTACVLIFIPIAAFDTECLVSKNKHFPHDYFHYPIDIFASDKVIEQEKDRALPCFALDLKNCAGNSSCHLCPPVQSFCPLANQNILDALRRSSSRARSSLCILKEKLRNANEVVNVYAAGGSVTVGCQAAGCCTNAECNPPSSSWTTLSCAWPSRFAHWLNTTYPAHVNFINIGDHGRTSILLVDDLGGALKKVHAPPFTSNDLILLDHSVNDNGYGSFGLEHGVEMLIRRIYHHSKPHSFPTIVLLDADPNPYRGVRLFNYSDVYERIGKYYDIPVWSYRDAVLSNFSRINQSRYVDHINFLNNVGRGTHPGWHVHLFMADLYAGVFESDTEKYCNLDNSENKALYDAHVRQRSRTFADLPVALSANATLICENELLSLSYDSIMENLSPVGSYRFEPERGGWNLTVDKAGRQGGFIVTKDAPINSKVIFSWNITTKELVSRQMKFQILIHYLRSYENAGIIEYSVCNRTNFTGYSRFNTLDALWKDYHSHRFSLPDKWAPNHLTIPYTVCTDFGEERPTMELTFRHQGGSQRGNQKFKLLNIKICQINS